MHPLALWLISSSQLRERDREDRLMRRQREARIREVAIARDGRWAAALHRWVIQDDAAQNGAIQNVSAPSVAAPTAAPSAVGCAAA